MPTPDFVFDFKRPDYNLIYTQRMARLDWLRDNPDELEAVREYYKDHPVDFISDFGMTFDPRNVELGLPATVPFILFPRQREFVEWIVARWKGREDGLVEKSRDMGASWLCVAIAAWMILFHRGVVVGFGSRKEEYVDKIGDPKTLLWKARNFIDLLPAEFKPEGWDIRRSCPFMRILNPAMESAIIGEAGDNIGRGARTSLYFKDEAAFYERPELIEAALSQTSNCKIDISSVNGNGNPFYRKRHAGKIPVFTFHWTEDPRKDDKWYQKQVESLDPVIVAQEIDIDYNASVTDAWINGADIERAQRTGPADVDSVGHPWIVAIDAAHMGDDESVIHKRKGRFNEKQIIRRQVDGHILAAVVEQECTVLEMMGDTVAAIVIELDGPGVSAYDYLKRSKYADIVQGIHTGTREANGRDYNLKARAWRAAKEYLAAGNVCMDRDPELKSQLASVKYTYRDGLLLMEAKKDHKKRTGKSPDRADAFVLTFAANTGAKKKVHHSIPTYLALDTEIGY